MWRHPNLRMAYVAQHAFHHLEEHLDISPVTYMFRRFGLGLDVVSEGGLAVWGGGHAETWECPWWCSKGMFHHLEEHLDISPVTYM